MAGHFLMSITYVFAELAAEVSPIMSFFLFSFAFCVTMFEMLISTLQMYVARVIAFYYLALEE
jgi:F0F1-type ATP synthase membrane subunit a